MSKWAKRIAKAGGAEGARRVMARTAPLIDGLGLPRQAPYAEPPPSTKTIADSQAALRGRISYQAGPQHTRYSTYVADGLNPATIRSVLRDADLGIMFRWADLCEQVLERDGHLHSVDRGRRVEVSGKPFRVQPVANTPTAQTLAKFVRAVVDQIDSYDRSVYAMLQANALGYSLNEIVYAQGRVRFPGADGKAVTLEGLYPRQIDWVHPKHLRFNRDTDEPLIDMGAGGMLPLPAHKFIFHPAAGDGLYERRGHMRACVWLHLFKQQCVRDWAVFGAMFGLPNVLAKYPRGVLEPQEARTMYELLLQDYGQGKPIIIPDDLDVSLTAGPTGTGNAAQVQMVGWANTEISKAVQGETLTTELSQTGSYNIGDIHADTKHAIVRDDARGLASDVRSDLFRSIVELNVDELMKLTGVSRDEVLAAVPLCSWRIERETNPVQRAQILVNFANAGLPIGTDQVYDEFGIDAPSENVKLLPGEPVSVSSGGKVVGSTEAAKGVEAPKEEPPAEEKPDPKAPPKLVRFAGDFKESDHPRASDGEFSPGGGASGGNGGGDGNGVRDPANHGAAVKDAVGQAKEYAGAAAAEVKAAAKSVRAGHLQKIDEEHERGVRDLRQTVTDAAKGLPQGYRWAADGPNGEVHSTSQHVVSAEIDRGVEDMKSTRDEARDTAKNDHSSEVVEGAKDARSDLRDALKSAKDSYDEVIREGAYDPRSGVSREEHEEENGSLEQIKSEARSDYHEAVESAQSEYRQAIDKLKQDNISYQNAAFNDEHDQHRESNDGIISTARKRIERIRQDPGIKWTDESPTS